MLCGARAPKCTYKNKLCSKLSKDLKTIWIFFNSILRVCLEGFCSSGDFSKKKQGKLSGSEQGHDGREQDESVFFQQQPLWTSLAGIFSPRSRNKSMCIAVHTCAAVWDFLFDLENFLYFSLRSELQSLMPVVLTNDKRQKGFFSKVRRFPATCTM